MFKLYSIKSAVKKKLNYSVKFRVFTILTISFLSFGSLLAIAQLSAPALIKADRLQSDNYVIQFGNFNMGSGQTEPEPGQTYSVSYTLGQLAAGPYGAYQGDPSGVSYFIGSGFQYIYQIKYFTFTISETDIDLGILTPGIFSDANNQLAITTQGAGGYSVYAYALHPLLHHGGTHTIPDTTCDSGITCLRSEAKEWTDPDQPGFGFNAQGETVMSDFTSDDPDCSDDDVCFRPFADASSGHDMEKVMELDAGVRAADDTATITYRATIDAAQAAGDYNTGIVYVAVPGY